MTTQNKQKKTTPTPPEQKEASIKRVAEKIDKDINTEIDNQIKKQLDEPEFLYIHWSKNFFKQFYNCSIDKLSELKMSSDKIKKLITNSSRMYLEYDTNNKLEYDIYNHRIKGIQEIEKITKDQAKENKTPNDIIYAFVLYKSLKNLDQKNLNTEDKKQIRFQTQKIHGFFMKKYFDFQIVNKEYEKFDNSDDYQTIKVGEETYFVPKKGEESETLYILNGIEKKEKNDEREEKLNDCKKIIPRFLNIISEINPENNSNIYYRGQSNAIWKLCSSISRNKEYEKEERNMFHKLIELKPDAFKNDDTTYEKLITMQHFGLPTRLLDITRNPLIALFFACDFSIEKETKEDDGKVLLFNKDKDIKEKKLEEYFYYSEKLKELHKYYYALKESDEKDKPTKPELLEKICYINGIAKNPRITNQCGDFIFVGNKNNDINYKRELEKLPRYMIVIDASLKEKILKELEQFNIHAGTVYPDLSHMADYLKYKYNK